MAFWDDDDDDVCNSNGYFNKLLGNFKITINSFGTQNCE